MRKLYVGYGLLRAEHADELLLDQPARHAAERHHGQRREDRQASQIAYRDDHRDSDNRGGCFFAIRFLKYYCRIKINLNLNIRVSAYTAG